MSFPPFYFILFVLVCSCQNAASEKTSGKHADLTAEKRIDTLPTVQKVYDSLHYEGSTLLASAPGTKSVLFNSSGSKLYAMNLEGMSVYEFSQATRELVRIFKFRKTPGIGWDYETDKPISSFQEKPVEAFITQIGRAHV